MVARSAPQTGKHLGKYQSAMTHHSYDNTMYNQNQYMRGNSEFTPNNHFDDTNQKLYYKGSQHGESQMMEGGDAEDGFNMQPPRNHSSTGRVSKTRPTRGAQHQFGYQRGQQPSNNSASRLSQEKGESESSLSNLIR